MREFKGFRTTDAPTELFRLNNQTGLKLKRLPNRERLRVMKVGLHSYPRKR